MLAKLIDVSGWTYQEWLAACILAFIVVTIVIVLHRIFKITQMTRKQRYTPNLRPLRRRSQYYHDNQRDNQYHNQRQDNYQDSHRDNKESDD